MLINNIASDLMYISPIFVGLYLQVFNQAGRCIQHQFYLATPILLTLQKKSVINRYIIIYKKMFFKHVKINFLIPTCYKGAYKYMYLCKGKTGEKIMFYVCMADEVNIIPSGLTIWRLYMHFECGYGLASYILGDTSNGQHC